MKKQKRRSSREKVGSILSMVAGGIWVSLGLSKQWVKPEVNMAIVIIGISLILFNLYLFYDDFKLEH